MQRPNFAARIARLLFTAGLLILPAAHAQMRLGGFKPVPLQSRAMQAGRANPQPAQPPLSLSLIDPGPIGAATTTAEFAHLAVGAGYLTVFTFVNTGDTPVTGSLLLTGLDGNPLTARLSSGTTEASASEIPINIPSGGTQFVTASPLSANDPTKTGWARVESSGGTLGGVGTFQYSPGGSLQTIAGVLSSAPVTTATIPLDDDVAANRYTGFAVANPSTTDTITIRVQTVNANGTPAATLSAITLQPGKQTATFVVQDPAASQKFTGSAVLIEQSGKPFLVVALVQNQNLYTAIPVIPAKAPNIN